MPPKRRGLLQRSAPKQFRCTGYGQCNMVFTRSEHLARHERKHTGEKPYKCVVENCGRMFSRFDNMMQHTQTHERKKFATIRETVEDQAKTKKARAVLTDDPVTDSPIQMQEEAIPWFQQTEPYQVPPLEYTPMMYNRTLPPPHRRFSIPSNTSGFYRPHYPYSSSPSPVKTHFCHSSNMHFPHPPPPPPVASNSYYRRSHYPPRNRLSWPIRSYEEFESTRRSSTSTASTDSGHTSSPPSLTHEFAIKRRISIDALQTPIENLKAIQLDEKPVKKESVDITQDEYEALEAFSQFRSSVVDSSSPVTSSPRDSPRLSSQVCAMRQSVPTSKLSFSRPVFHNYLG